MSFLAPQAQAAPPPPPPPPNPPTLASSTVQDAASAARAAAAAANGAGFSNTLKTSTEGAPAPTTTTGKALTGQ